MSAAGNGPRAPGSWFGSVAAFVLIFAALWLLHAPLLRLPYFWDEAGYFVPAARDILLSGSLIPQSTLSNAHPPLVMLWLVAWWKLFGYAPLVTRTAMLAMAAFGLLGVYRLGERVANRTVALASVALTALYPVFFAQSSLAHLDIGAFAFTTWGVLFYVNGRRAACIAFFALATVAKETAFAAPLALCCWGVLCWLETRGGNNGSRSNSWLRSWCFPANLKGALALLSAALPLLAWYGFHALRTGRLFGAEFLSYNLGGTVSPLRIPLALVNRVWGAAGYMNLFMLTAASLFATRLPSISARGTTESDAAGRGSIASPTRAVFLVLIGAYVLMLSLVGGAALARYLLPVTPLVILLSVSALYRTLRLWWGWCALCGAAFVLALVMPSPWRIAPEDNLAYADFVRLHQQAAAYLERRYGGERVLTAWPASDELNRPFLGYVSRPLTVVRIENFSGLQMLTAAQQRNSFDVAFLFSTKYDPAANPMNRFDWWNRLQARFFDYHRDLPPEVAAKMLGGRIVWQRSAGAEWVAIVELDAIRNAALPSSTAPDLRAVTGASGPVSANLLRAKFAHREGSSD